MTLNRRPSLSLLIAAGCAVFFLALFLVPAAHAAGPLSVCQSGQPFVWPGGGANIPFNPDQGDLGPLTNAQAVQLTQDAFNVWGAVPTATATYTNAGLLPVDVDITNFDPFLNPLAPDGLSAIVFDDTGEIFDLLFGPGSGILGFAGPEWVDTVTCDILEGVSFLNGPSFGDLTAAFDVMVHEFGHYSNLAHTEVNGQLYIGVGDLPGPEPVAPYVAPDPFVTEVVETMYPFYFGPGIGTGSLHRDDISSLSALYPDPSFAASTDDISGTIFAPNGTTRLTGVNIIARNEADPFTDAVSAVSSDYTDDFSQADPVTGTYTLYGLTPGADYRIYVDEILAGGFSTPPLTPLPGPEEYYNGANESNNVGSTDDPADFVFVTPGATGIDVIFNAFGPGDPLPVGIDGNVELFLPFNFRFCGETYDSVFVNANGNLTFGVPSTDFTESAGEFLSGPPRIAALWDDLNVTAGGSVFFTQSSNSFTVHWEDVPEFLDTGANSFSIKLKRFGNLIYFDYDDLTATDGLAGVSCGGAVTSGFEQPIDIGNRFLVNLLFQPAEYEVFDVANPNDLANDRILFTPTTNYEDWWAENNDTISQAQYIHLPFDSIPVYLFTEIEPTGDDVDWYKFWADGDTTLIAEILTGQLDTVITVADAGGNQLALDDDGGAGLLSRIVLPIPSDGFYYFGVSTFPDTDFSGDGNSGGRYVMNLATIDGTLLSLGDDDSVEVTLPFSFPFQGSSYNSVFVNSNGNLTFGAGDTDFSESESEFLNGLPRIAPLWDDLSPNAGGLVIVEEDATSWTVTFDAVPEFFASTTNTFSVTLDTSGDVSISYGGIASVDSVVGITEGGGAAPGESDLSTGGPFSNSGTTYEVFTFGDEFDLDGQTLDFQ